jgi:hypothetical protein
MFPLSVAFKKPVFYIQPCYYIQYIMGTHSQHSFGGFYCVSIWFQHWRVRRFLDDLIAGWFLKIKFLCWTPLLHSGEPVTTVLDTVIVCLSDTSTRGRGPLMVLLPVRFLKISFCIKLYYYIQYIMGSQSPQIFVLLLCACLIPLPMGEAP